MGRLWDDLLLRFTQLPPSPSVNFLILSSLPLSLFLFSISHTPTFLHSPCTSLALSLASSLPLHCSTNDTEKERKQQRESTFPHFAPFGLEQIAWVSSWDIVVCLSLHYLQSKWAEDPCLDCFSIYLSWNHCLIALGRKKGCKAHQINAEWGKGWLTHRTEIGLNAVRLLFCDPFFLNNQRKK